MSYLCSPALVKLAIHCVNFNQFLMYHLQFDLCVCAWPYRRPPAQYPLVEKSKELGRKLATTPVLSTIG